MVDEVKKNIEFDNVVFSYRPDLPKVLDGVSFQIPAGKITAVVGRTTHSGRSTLAKLIFRYDYEDLFLLQTLRAGLGRDSCRWSPFGDCRFGFLEKEHRLCETGADLLPWDCEREPPIWDGEGGLG